ncbi:MAG: hypothetical protein ACT4QF_11755 [Sporichthyaceae bacterium]
MSSIFDELDARLAALQSRQMHAPSTRRAPVSEQEPGLLEAVEALRQVQREQGAMLREILSRLDPPA